MNQNTDANIIVINQPTFALQCVSVTKKVCN